jgi:hypothetical protein
MLQLLDPEAADKWTWQFHAASGAFSVSATVDCRCYLIPVPDGSGIFRVVLHHQDGSYQTLTEGLPQVEAMHRAGEWLAQNATLQLAASTWWHRAPASEGQIRALHHGGIDATRLTRGEASGLISDFVAARVVPQIIRRLRLEGTIDENGRNPATATGE